MYKFCFYDLKVHFWWPNKCLKYNISSLNTLYDYNILLISTTLGDFWRKFDITILVHPYTTSIKPDFRILHQLPLTKLDRITWGLLELSKPDLSFTYWQMSFGSNPSCLEAHAEFFRPLMKGIFDPYVLWPFDKNWLATRIRIRNYTVFAIIFSKSFKTAL